MSPFDPTIDASFREYADLQWRRHILLTEGKEQAPEFDRIEDRMTELWKTLDTTQRQSVNGMGSDLNSIRRKGQPAPKSRQAGDVTPAERQDLVDARQRNDWHKFLYDLRVCSSTIPAASLAYSRGQAYEVIGLPTYSIGFYELAADLEPANASMGMIAMWAMARIDPDRALSRAELVLASSVRFPPGVVALGTLLLLRRDKAEGRTGDKTRYEGILEDAISRLKLEPQSNDGQVLVYQLAAFGFEIIDNLPTAERCYEAGLRLSPDNKDLLMGKGLLLYGRRTNEAVAAFGRVVSHEGSPHVWPYFFLANYFLLRRNYDESIKMSKQAWERATSDPIRAELLEWQAIALSESGYPPELVRPWFEKALSLDPSNQRIKQNTEVFEQALSAFQRRSWDIEPEETLRVERATKLTDLGLLPVF